MKNPLNELSPALRRWLWRIALVSAILSLIGLTTQSSVSPLLCKIYG
ncbi:MAG: hypothetical protein ACK4Z4_10865 [Ferrovibrio sp.]